MISKKKLRCAFLLLVMTSTAAPAGPVLEQNKEFEGGLPGDVGMRIAPEFLNGTPEGKFIGPLGDILPDWMRGNPRERAVNFKKREVSSCNSNFESEKIILDFKHTKKEEVLMHTAKVPLELNSSLQLFKLTTTKYFQFDYKKYYDFLDNYNKPAFSFEFNYKNYNDLLAAQDKHKKRYGYFNLFNKPAPSMISITTPADRSIFDLSYSAQYYATPNALAELPRSSEHPASPAARLAYLGKHSCKDMYLTSSEEFSYSLKVNTVTNDLINPLNNGLSDLISPPPGGQCVSEQPTAQGRDLQMAIQNAFLNSRPYYILVNSFSPEPQAKKFSAMLDIKKYSCRRNSREKCVAPGCFMRTTRYYADYFIKSFKREGISINFSFDKDKQLIAELDAFGENSVLTLIKKELLAPLASIHPSWEQTGASLDVSSRLSVSQTFEMSTKVNKGASLLIDRALNTLQEKIINGSL